MTVDREAVSRALEDLKASSFPPSPEDPDLGDWIMELLEIDGHYAGLATTVDGSGRATPPTAHELDDLRDWLGHVRVATPGDEEILAQCRSYFGALERLHAALRAP